MKHSFEINRTTRNMVSTFLENYSLEQLNKIPEGYSNNLIWNIGHIVISQQLLVYKLSGLPMMVSDEMVDKYKKGSKVEHFVDQDEVNILKGLLFATLNKTELDSENNVFQNYTEYPTSTGFVIKSAQSAIDFNNFHEGLHIGIMMSIRKFI